MIIRKTFIRKLPKVRERIKGGSRSRERREAKNGNHERFCPTKCRWTEVHDHQIYLVSGRRFIVRSHVQRNVGSPVERDQDGVAFLDFNPEYFGWILDYLRAKKISSPENPAVLAEVPKNQMKNFNTLLEYLGLSDEIMPTRPTEVLQNEKFSECSSGITAQENGQVAVRDPSANQQYVLGENVYQRGIVRFKLKLESFHSND